MKKEYSIQDFHRFSDQIADIVADYIKYSSEVDEADGIIIDEDDNIELANCADLSDLKDFYPISTLVQGENGALVPDYDAIDDLTSRYIFVR